VVDGVWRWRGSAGAGGVAERVCRDSEEFIYYSDKSCHLIDFIKKTIPLQFRSLSLKKALYGRPNLLSEISGVFIILCQS